MLEDYIFLVEDALIVFKYIWCKSLTSSVTDITVQKMFEITQVTLQVKHEAVKSALFPASFWNISLLVNIQYKSELGCVDIGFSSYRQTLSQPQRKRSACLLWPSLYHIIYRLHQLSTCSKWHAKGQPSKPGCVSAYAITTFHSHLSC